MKKLISIATVVAAMFAVTVQAQNNSERLPVTLSDPAKPALVRVSLLNGSITVRTHAGKDVIVEGRAAERSAIPETRDGLRRIDSNRGGLTIEESGNVVTISNQNFRGGGNIEIEVPVRTNLKLNAINGGTILVDGVDGEIDVQNTNGNVRLVNVSGSVVAHAMNGTLFATVREVASNKPMSFSSMNANVDVTLPPNTKANLKIRSDNGAAYSDFEVVPRPGAPPTIEENRRGGNGRFRIEIDRTTNGTINGGGPDIELRTFNGNVFLRKGK